MTEICVHKKGTVNSKFIEVHNLISCSHSDYFIAFFLSWNEHSYSTAKYSLLTFQLISKWTNLKATLDDSVPDGSCYQDYKSFSALEIRQNMGFTPSMNYLLWKGLWTSFIHSVKMKFMAIILCTIHLDQTLIGDTVISRQSYHARIQKSILHQGLCIQIGGRAQSSSVWILFLGKRRC